MNHARSTVRLLAGLTASALVAGTLAATTTSYAGPRAMRPADPGAMRSAGPSGGWEPRPARYPGTVVEKDLAIPMSDGTVLRGDLTLPADADGEAVERRFPVVVTITAYNKTALGSSGGLGGTDPGYLVRRGYAQLTVDARGTGSSEGSWNAFGRRENRDGKEVVEWAHARRRPWSNGHVGMSGPSYMGINQIFTAAQHPAGLDAIFPQVPAGDVYRDVVASGGQIDVGFIPLWLGLVTATGLVPPATLGSDSRSGVAALLDHLGAAGSFTAPLLLDAALGGDAAYDGPFYRERSPLRVIDRVRVPTFLVGGEHDLFQRGTPMLFEHLQANDVPTRLIVGPWDHLQGSSGADVGDAGHGTLAELQLRWFDHWLRGRPDPGLARDVPPVTRYEQGSGRWRASDSWLPAGARARSYLLSGDATTGGAAGTLTTGTPQPGTADVLPVPVAGLCTRSADQWTAGLPNAVLADNPCFTDNAPNDRAGVVFETAPVTRAVRFAGPINAHLFTSSTSGDGMLSVAVEDVAPDGTVTRLTGGWQVLSQRALDADRTRYLDGRVLQPFHPFTRASKQPLGDGEVAPVDVEVFPTAASIRPGHRLRIAVQAFDVPHLAPAASDLPGTLAVMTIHASRRYPSELTVPWVGAP
ncbi:CocE/NonD family hydrolase [Nocardioides sp. MAHUQ-72]|uniref:CocE/NonD family hydrolase n=1 Tax=unclassified Nocardioides TaxID=2615069 RepID=UPI003617BBC4